MPGLGTDRRIFSKLLPLLDVEEIVVMEYIRPENFEEPLYAYASRLVTHYGITSEDKLLGFSLGGCIILEISKLLNNVHLYLIATIKTEAEGSHLFKLLRKAPVHKFIPTNFLKRAVPVLGEWSRTITPANVSVIRAMFFDFDPIILDWGTHAGVNWENTEVPKQAIHIHGTRDFIFPHYSIKATYLIEKGTHNMIMSKAIEISDLINQHLND